LTPNFGDALGVTQWVIWQKNIFKYKKYFKGFDILKYLYKYFGNFVKKYIFFAKYSPIMLALPKKLTQKLFMKHIFAFRRAAQQACGEWAKLRISLRAKLMFKSSTESLPLSLVPQ